MDDRNKSLKEATFGELSHEISRRLCEGGKFELKKEAPREDEW